MTRKRFNVVTIAAMIAILALGGLGLGYAQWTDQLTVNGSASTGNLNVVWSGASNGNDGGDPLANCNVSVADAGKTLNIELQKMYPGYDCVVTIVVDNTASTVPVKFDPTTPYQVLATNFANLWSPATVVSATADSNCTLATVIAAGATHTCTSTITMDASAANDDTEGKSASFSVDLNVVQATP